MSFEEIIGSLDDTTVLTRGLVLDLYSKFGAQPSTETQDESPAPTVLDWRERIWVCPAETQVSVSEFAEAANRKRSWGYEQVKNQSAAPVHFDEAGRPYFVAEEVREWLRSRGESVVRGKADDQ